MNLYNCDFNKKLKIVKLYLHGINRRKLYNIGVIKDNFIYKLSTSLYKDKICLYINNEIIIIPSIVAYDIQVEYA